MKKQDKQVLHEAQEACAWLKYYANKAGLTVSEFIDKYYK